MYERFLTNNIVDESCVIFREYYLNIEYSGTSITFESIRRETVYR